MTKSAKQIRETFLNFFRERRHIIMASAPIVLKDDPTLMFTNAGMNQFKDFFLGNKPPEHKRVANSQKCLRVSGKHNDLEEVGRDGYHHTMFEMLGNWSFGDYFKKEAIAWAWELLTKELGLPEDRIYVTVFGGDEKDKLSEDSEAAEIWKEWIDKARILSFSKKDNFWEMGDTGPCGPCSEIHVDLRPDHEIDRIPGSELVNSGHPDVIEIWNLVFIQFNRRADSSLEPLPSRHIDTGMGFERLVRVVQGKASNYDTDIFAPLIHYIEQATGISYQSDYSGNVMSDVAMRVLSDHVRAVSFGIADGELPSNTGAGYVLRRILRRAVRYYYTFLNIRDPLLYRLVDVLADFFGNTFPGFIEQKDFIKKVIQQEEISFLRTLEGGLKRFEALKVSGNKLSGKDAFELYDTYGFPIDLTRLMAAERGWKIDEAEFQEALSLQKHRSRTDAAKVSGDWIDVYASTVQPKFEGYDTDIVEGSRLIRYRPVESKEGLRYQLVLDRTSFYPEGGGQVGDTGYLIFGEDRIEVLDVMKENDLPVHITKRLPQSVSLPVVTQIDVHRRRLIENNHSATHLLHAALREVLGDHVQQKGSLVNADYLRFDFSHFGKMTPEELTRVESLVNRKIRENVSRKEDRNIPIADAQKAGARMLFGEKYGETVRMITFDQDFSIELCGGCHVRNTGSIGYFKITGESAIAAGVRRIEAITAEQAEAYINDHLNQLAQIKQELKAPADPIKAIRDLQSENKELRKQLEEAEVAKAAHVKAGLMNEIENLNGIRFLAKEVEVSDPKLLKNLLFQIGNELGNNYFLLLGSGMQDKAQIALHISDDLIKSKNFHAGHVVKELAKFIEGGGGGQPFFASAGGILPAGLGKAIEESRKYLK